METDKPFCPICGYPEENQGSTMIRICGKCQKIFSDKVDIQINQNVEIR